MRERKINFTSRQLAILSGYKLVFNKKAKDGDFTYANIVPSEHDFVEGAVYEFPDDEITNLDTKEGYPKHYNKVQVIISDKLGNEIQAVTYIAQTNKIIEGLFPQKKYLKHLLAGQDILSKEYFEWLSKTKTCEE